MRRPFFLPRAVFAAENLALRTVTKRGADLIAPHRTGRKRETVTYDGCTLLLVRPFSAWPLELHVDIGRVGPKRS